ncbi:MAG TPA: glucosamine-6-phosphate deaminase [Patescibacteria group bacterium]|nr:glucosamine-6-phosphate deaminase [Patescibacteria group bacterium]
MKAKKMKSADPREKAAPGGNSLQTQTDSYQYSILTKFERMPTIIYADTREASKAVALEIAELIRRKKKQGKMCILGFATGSTPTRVYSELARLHRQEGLSFANVISFNLDEYFPMQPDSLHSYVHFMCRQLFDQVDIRPENIHIPDGSLPVERMVDHCRSYEETIRAAGGIDLQVLGIGRTGHIAFNEPGSQVNSVTRIITLDSLTRKDAASDFFGLENVPRRAITMGIGSVLSARRILLMAWGEGKAAVIRQAVEGDISAQCPASFLQTHKNIMIVLDEAAAAELTRVKTPWLLDACEWSDRLVRKAVVWLCQKLNKPILKLTNRDYNDNGMSGLLAEKGTAYQINIKVFNDLQHTITGWPGGKPNADDIFRPERAVPARKRVLIFSPHPEDDMVAMGGTLLRLVEHGHDVNTAYQTSGNLTVADEDALRFIDFAESFNATMVPAAMTERRHFRKIKTFLLEKNPGQVDPPAVRELKTLIRQGEARAACRYAGIRPENVHFMNMPFYETGTRSKLPLSEQDVKLVVDLLRRVKPHQIFAAGDLSDPHDTHRLCLDAIKAALQQVGKEPWFRDCYIWFYRGAWEEWEIEQIDMAVPISPEELERKRSAIFKHQTQKDGTMLLGGDIREVWERAEERNRGTARLYDTLGMAEYEAIEAFKRFLP